MDFELVGVSTPGYAPGVILNISMCFCSLCSLTCQTSVPDGLRQLPPGGKGRLRLCSKDTERDQRLLTFAIGFRSSTAPLPARMPSCERISRFFLSSSILATELHDLGEAEESLLPFLPQSRGRKGRDEGSLAQYVSWNPSLCVAGLQAASDMPHPSQAKGRGRRAEGRRVF